MHYALLRIPRHSGDLSQRKGAFSTTKLIYHCSLAGRRHNMLREEEKWEKSHHNLEGQQHKAAVWGLVGVK